MPHTPTLEQLITEFQQLDVHAEPQRARALLAQATARVDRTAAPAKWAGLRSVYGDLVEPVDPAAAIAAHRDALSAWDPVAHHDACVHSHMQLGWLLAAAPPGSDDAEAAIAHLEQVVPERPFMARHLAFLYSVRPGGDPSHNWQRRMACLRIACAQADPGQGLAAWAAVHDELACAWQDEPAGDYAVALERRIAGHHEVLARLVAEGGDAVPTGLHLATAYMDRVQGPKALNVRAARRHIRQALAACTPATDPALRVQLLLLQGRGMLFRQARPRPGVLRQAIAVMEQARALAAPRPQPELRASVEKLLALAHLEALRQGRRTHLDAFNQCCAAALALCDGAAFDNERRKLLQIQADGLVAAGELRAAGACCAAAIALAERRLAEATTVQGRLERIWELRDSALLQAHCLAHEGRLADAVDVLDRGKARLWATQPLAPASTLVGPLLPPGGALLWPVCAGDVGRVIVATAGAAGAAGPVFSQVALPRLGKAQLMALQRGADDAVLGGWLLAYCHRQSQPEAFFDAIDSTGHALQQALWAPLLDHLRLLGVAPGAELVLFPQGALASLPLQAAGWGDDASSDALAGPHPLRLAPSVDALARAQRADCARGPMTVIAADPAGDLPQVAREAGWIRDAMPGARVLDGVQATPANTLAALHTSAQVHIASHAAFDLDDPLASRIVLAGGALSVAQLTDHLATQRPAFVALSACETAVTRVTSLADEFLGFPAALLGAGVRTVLATQWPVADDAAALLMGEFYRRLARGDASAAQALAQARRWLRDLTADARDALLGNAPAPAADLPADAPVDAPVDAPMEATTGDARPFAHPYFWAGFCIIGVPSPAARA